MRKQLAKSQQAEAHPDADMLSAFSEGSLLPRERETVLAHLALCARCREVLRIATDAMPEPMAEAQVGAQTKLLVHPPLRRWLPWVAIAAATVVVSSTLLLHQQNKIGRKAPSVESARLAHTETTEAPAATAQPSPDEKNAPRQTPNSLGRSQTTSRRAENSGDVAARDAALPAAPPEEQRAPAITPQAGIAEGPAIAAKKSAPAASQTVKTFDEAAARSREAFSNAAPVPMMRSPLRPHWRINELGQLERSVADGAWQAVPMLDVSKLHVVAVSGSEVWAGGENLRLEHSTDNGATWQSIKLPPKNGYKHALTHIRFQSTQEGTIDADDGTSWKTTDSGRTWK